MLWVSVDVSCTVAWHQARGVQYIPTACKVLCVELIHSFLHKRKPRTNQKALFKKGIIDFNVLNYDLNGAKTRTFEGQSCDFVFENVG